MERVVTVNLNGNPYQLEEPAHEALRAYLSRAEAALAGNPDKAEIIRDLEQAIAEKCATHLSEHKSVVAASEMTSALQEMGPVESGEGGEAAGAEASAFGAPPRRRLYRLRDRAIISGVCSGLGAYFDLDANLIRFLFILAALFTSGGMILIYIVLMFAIPSAHTSEEWAAAHGVPFNAQEVIDRAKREAGRAAEDTRSVWRRERRAWRRQHRDAGYWGWERAAPPPQPAGYVTRMFAGLFALIFSLITAALLIAFLVALFSLLGAGSVLDWALPAGVPLWLAIVVVCIAYAAISAPFSAMRRSSFATLSGGGAGAPGDGFATLMLVALALGFAWLFWDEARLMMEQAYLFVRSAVTSWN